MKIDSNPINIHDDSHAKAILKGEFRKAREEYLKVLQQLCDKFLKKTPNKKNHYKYICQVENTGLKHTLIEKTLKKRSFKREVSQFYSLGYINVDDGGIRGLKNTRLYPVCIHEIDSADPWGDKSDYDLKVLFYFTEHALVKMVRRHNVNSLKSIATIVRKNIHPLLSEKTLANLPDNDFVIVNGDAYIPCTHEYTGDLIGILVIKTWISRDAWTVQNEAKLTNLCNFLRDTGEIRIFTNDEFDSAVYFEPK